jgi:hypothetical protein
MIAARDSKRVPAVAVAVALALLGCSHPARRPVAPHPDASGTTVATPRVHDAYRVDRLDVPRELAAHATPTICGPGLVAVPWHGGLVLAGWHGWLVEPARGPIGDVAACDAQARVVTIRDSWLFRISPDAPAAPLAEVPSGHFAVEIDHQDDTIWLYGSYADGSGGLLRFAHGLLEPVWKGHGAVDAAAARGRALVTCIGTQVLLWAPRTKPKRLARLDERCDGVAIDPKGRVFVSTPSGVMQLRGKQPPALITTGVHGALAARTSRIYVLWQAEHAVFALAPVR